jgi:hypothetical protein
MSDKPVALLVTTLIGAPLMLVCCVGGVSFLAAIFGGITGFFSGFGLLAALLIALAVLTVSTIIRHRRGIQNDKSAVEIKPSHRASR